MTKKNTFQTIYDQTKQYNGKEFSIIDEQETESGTLWTIQFKDGETIEAWPEEIFYPI